MSGRYGKNLDVFRPEKHDLKVILVSYESNICTPFKSPVLLNSLNFLQKRIKCSAKPHILSLFLNLFNKFIYTWALMWDPLINKHVLSMAKVLSYEGVD